MIDYYPLRFMNTYQEKHQEVLKNLPHQPGVYRFYTEESQLLYVGKAKDLRNRVNSYFQNFDNHSYKTKRLVKQIQKIEFTLVNHEYDALLLENNLIKTYQPKYNILLKDDKTYPYLCLTKEPFPKLFPTRRIEKGQGEYFGPYASVKTMNTLLELMRELFTLRTCHLHLSEANIKAKKFSVCLEYHLKNCLGPCEALQTEEDYLKDIAQARQILKGNIAQVMRYLKEKMQFFAENLEFEKAEEYKQKWLRLEDFQAKSLVVNPNLEEADIFAIISEEEKAYIHFFKMKNGAIIFSKNIEAKKKLEETDEEILMLTVMRLQEEFQSQANELISNVTLNLLPQNIQNTLPKIGDKKKLLDLALKNALFYKKERQRQDNVRRQKIEHNATLEELERVLKLQHTPRLIECFDNSNIQGTNPVAAMVHFKNGRPLKSEYRHFHIKTVEGPNDFASMKEIVFRRYKRLTEEEKTLPDLVVVDGGKGQLSSACEALRELNLYGKIPIIGIAKRLEEIYFPEDEIPIHINKKSPALRLLQNLRDEAHRFAITFHRDIRSKNSWNTELENIKGIGDATITRLLQQFRTIKNIKESSIIDLAQVVGKAKAKLVYDYFHKKNQET